LEPFFSRLGVTRLEPMLHEIVGLLNRRFESLKGTGTVVRLDHAFVAFSGDVISRICCENHTDMLEDPDFSPHWYVAPGLLTTLFHLIAGSIYSTVSFSPYL
jgi:hypothetical protein